MDNNVTHEPRPSTRAEAIANAVFGARSSQPGCHMTEADAAGWVWFLAVGRNGKVMCFQSMPQAFADDHTSNHLWAWHDTHDTPVTLTLLDGGKATTRARKARTLQVAR